MKLFNFSKKERTRIVVDNREKSSGIPELLKDFDIEFKNLDFGDYIVKGIVIERKSSTDFINSMFNGRLYSQLDKLKEQENSVLVIENVEDSKKIANPNSIRGFILSIILNYKVPIIFSDNVEETVKYISLIANKEKNERRLNFSKKAKNDFDQARYILESFPGIGPKTSKTLLNEFNSLEGIFSADETKLRKILGKKTENFKLLISKRFT